jgi:hypothetical protein
MEIDLVSHLENSGFILTGGCTLSSVAEIRLFVKVSLLMLLATNIIIHF